MTKVTVIIPNYNQSHYVADAVRSVLNQTYKNFDIIVVDDGSTDKSREVVAQFGEAVQYIYQKNQGLAGARNTGIRASYGELIGLLDADDEWCPTYLEHIVALSEKHPHAAAFYCMAQCMDAEGNDLPQVVGGPPVSPDLLYQKLLRANFIIPSTVTFRRKPILEAGYFDPNLRSCEDWDLWLRILPAETIVGMPESLVRYRIHGSSLSTNVYGMHEAAQKVIEKNFGPDDGQIVSWTFEKRRAHGGIYRYYLITSVQRQGNWNNAGRYLRRALEIDPTLAADLDMFFELSLGMQPNGYRSSDQHLDVRQNASEIKEMLADVFSVPLLGWSVRRLAYGTANFALGLAAYNSGSRKLCRTFLIRALFYRPDLAFDLRVSGNLFKSLLSPAFLEILKSLTSKRQGRDTLYRRST